MISYRSMPVLALCSLLLLGAPACATTQNEIIRTSRTEPVAAALPVQQLSAPADAVQTTIPFSAATFNVISDTLDAAAEAWSKDDIDGVMTFYDEDQPLLVMMGDAPLKGPEPVRELLEQQVQRPGGLGTMNYEWFEILQLDTYTAVISGRVVVTRNGQQSRGLFTRILRQTQDGWKIVHDHLALPTQD